MSTRTLEKIFKVVLVCAVATIFAVGCYALLEYAFPQEPPKASDFNYPLYLTIGTSPDEMVICADQGTYKNCKVKDRNKTLKCLGYEELIPPPPVQKDPPIMPEPQR